MPGAGVTLWVSSQSKPCARRPVLTPEEGFPKLPSSEMWLERANRELPRAAKCLYEFLLEQLPPWE